MGADRRQTKQAQADGDRQAVRTVPTDNVGSSSNDRSPASRLVRRPTLETHHIRRLPRGQEVSILNTFAVRACVVSAKPRDRACRATLMASLWSPALRVSLPSASIVSDFHHSYVKLDETRSVEPTGAAARISMQHTWERRRAQYAFRPRSRANAVSTMIFRSSHSDQWRKYSMSQ